MVNCLAVSIGMHFALKEAILNIFKMNQQQTVMETVPLANLSHEKSAQVVMNTPFEIPPTIEDGLCSNCDYRTACVWQHNNKLYCEHFN